jgi:hypothetical protein
LALETLKQKSPKQRTGENHPAWKGDNASYFSIHRWLYNRLGKPTRCKQCGAEKDDRTIQWSSISGKSQRKLDDWQQLCVPCHKRYDRWIKYGNRCPKGHDLTLSENTGTAGKSKDGIPYLCCLACKRIKINTDEHRKYRREYERKRRAKLRGSL